MKSRNKNPQNNKTISERTLETLELPRDIFLGMPLLSMTGNRTLCITNHRGIRQYGNEMVVIAAKPFTIKITGRNLYIPSLSGDQVEITGYMESVLFLS